MVRRAHGSSCHAEAKWILPHRANNDNIVAAISGRPPLRAALASVAAEAGAARCATAAGRWPLLVAFLDWNPVSATVHTLVTMHGQALGGRGTHIRDGVISVGLRRSDVVLAAGMQSAVVQECSVISANVVEE